VDVTQLDAPAVPAPPPDGALRGVLAVLALCSVAPLLAWVFGLGRFAAWFRFLTLPALAVVAVAAFVVSRPRSRHRRIRTAMVVGAMGGLLGTIGYDLIRIPVVFLGYRVLAPIDSYGVLLLDDRSSSDVSGLAGWLFHFSNGINFAIAYALVALGRDWRWGVVWAMFLETVTVVTPFVDAYGLSGKWGLIAVAYAAHIPYGLGVGWAASRAETLERQLVEVGRRVPTIALALLVLGLALWHLPLSRGDDKAITEVDRGHFSPEWLRIPVGECIEIRHPDRLEERCFDKAGVHRIRLEGRPHSGGFVIVDEAIKGAQR
jgi:hypothetical protein